MFEASITLMLAKIIGLYLIAVGVGAMLTPNRMGEVLEGLRNNAGLTFVTGIVAFAIGAALVLIHNDWQDLIASAVSAIGWIALVKGFFLLALPQPFLTFGSLFQNAFLMRIWGLVVTALGGAYIYLACAA